MKGLLFLQELAELAPEQLHRYALDWGLQKSEGRFAIINWEKREPGSLSAVLNAYARVIPWIQNNKRLTVNDLKSIHKICSAHMPSNCQAGHFRFSVVTFCISPKTSTEAGMKYFSDLYVNQYLENQKGKYGRILLNNGEALQFLLNCGEVVQYDQLGREDPEGFFKTLRNNNESFTFMGYIGDLNKIEIKLLRKIGHTIKEVEHELMQNQNIINSGFENRKIELIKKMALDRHPDVSPTEYEKVLTRLHQAIHGEMSKCLARLYGQLNGTSVTSAEKLYAIANAVQCLERIHPFNDVNCRTFCMVFLNILLIQNDFLPALIDDPNKFDGYDCDSLVELIKQGIQKTEILQDYVKANASVLLCTSTQASNYQWCSVPEEQKEMLSEMAESLKQAILSDKNHTYLSCSIS